MHQSSTFYRFWLYLICSTFLASCAQPDRSENRETESGKTLTVMTYNIQHGRGMDGEINLERIAQVILQEEADIVGLQEVDMGVERSGGIDIATRLAELTGLEHYVFGKNIDHQGGDYGNATLSRYPVTEYENFHFEQLANEQRGILTTRIDVEGFSLLLMNTHLAHRRQDEPERLIFIEKAKDEIIPRYQADGILFIGDFNDVPGSATHNAVKEFMIDVWETAGDGDGFTIPPVNPNRRIDYIFHNNHLRPSDARVPVSTASDHLPVVAVFEMD